MNIGFIGLGVMGTPMAGHLIDARHSVFLNRVKPSHQHLLDKGGISSTTPRSVAKESEVIILMVPDTPDVETVLFGENGVIEGVAPGKLIIDMSSISPSETKAFAKRLSDARCDYLDAPVSGGETGAINATLTIMVGGSPQAFERARPLFEILGKTITHMGPVGDGQVSKIANQIVVGLTIAAVAEAITFARAAGTDPEKVRQALMGGLANSKILDSHGKRMIDKAFEPGFRIQLHRKDMRLAVDFARQLGLTLPNTALVEQLMIASITNGDGQRDHSGIIDALERLAGH